MVLQYASWIRGFPFMLNAGLTRYWHFATTVLAFDPSRLLSFLGESSLRHQCWLYIANGDDYRIRNAVEAKLILIQYCSPRTLHQTMFCIHNVSLSLSLRLYACCLLLYMLKPYH